ncbi:hypothetical protein O6H91_02G047000 [Diphasiastrum complanatum]|uniref:Uncharacterized protein n=1 Tax=Diphasiastrum complanatum TaxID=34168 RepID=A0ACC2EFE6_DIPCM|nr:hypothetical protein O6H91_02G047000 [Diphasiastrum complanatum]
MLFFRFSLAKVQKDHEQRKLQAPPEKQSSARLLRNGKVRVIEPAQRKAKQQGIVEGRNASHSKSHTTEKLQPEDSADVNQAKIALHFSEDEEHRKLLTLLEEQRSLLQNQTASKQRENVHGMEKIDSEKEKPDKLQSHKIHSELHESEDDEPLSKFLKQDSATKDQKKIKVQDVEDDEPLFNILSKVKSSKKKKKVIGTPKAVSRQTSATELDIGASSKASSETELNTITSAFLENKSTTSGDSLLPSSKGDSSTIELSVIDESVPLENESPKLKASSTIKDHKVDNSATLGLDAVTEKRLGKVINKEQKAASLTMEDHRIDDSSTLRQHAVAEKRLGKVINKDQKVTGHSALQKKSVEEIGRTFGKQNKNSLVTKETLGRRKVLLDEPLYTSQKKARLLSFRKSRNIINKRINADSISQHLMPEVACPEVAAAHEKETVSAGELKALQEELYPIITERQQGGQKDLTNDLMEKWIEVTCKQLHTSFDTHVSIVQHFLCHSQGSCDKLSC